jgi:hypothetical protein
MRARLILPLVAVAILSSKAEAAIRYEFTQVTNSDVESIPNSQASCRIVTDGDNSRIDFIGGTLYRPGTYELALNGTRRIFVDPAKKTYSEISLPNAAATLGNGHIQISNLHATPQQFDDHPLIAGHRTVHSGVHISYDATVMFGSIPLRQSFSLVIDRWSTNEFGDVAEPFLVNDPIKTGNQELDKLIEAQAMKKGLTLRQNMSLTTERDAANLNPNSKLPVPTVRKQSSEMVVTDVSQVPTDVNSFAIPASYARYDPALDKPEESPVHMLSMEPDPTPATAQPASKH